MPSADQVLAVGSEKGVRKQVERTARVRAVVFEAADARINAHHEQIKPVRLAVHTQAQRLALERLEVSRPPAYVYLR